MERIGRSGGAVEVGSESVRSWASEIDDGTLRQALTSARCAAVSGPVALMPDAHVGIGATVGSVIPTEGAIIPAAVGVDLGCGMIAVRTDLAAGDLPESLAPLLASVERAIPAGFSAHPRTTEAAERWLAADPLADAEGLGRKDRAKIGPQLGTLGGGNHFVEVSLDTDERVWCVLHSGSRGIGNRLASGHITGARRLCADLQRALEDRDLAYYLESDPDFERYINHMLWAQRYAFANREIMMNALLAALGRAVGRRPGEAERINCHHNYAARETHGGRELWITRKGAIRARAGDRGVIPGSMGADSYVVTGLGNPDSYDSAAHGAGRRMSRKQAKRDLSIDDFRDAMAGRTWQADRAERLVDESPLAYKDIATVMTDQADLVRIDHILRAVMNYKGC
ncbi:MAG: RtcB family protein [Acidimicrobiia bacterium]|nr:RtcB family protein [Acidimicrobiia bacterium]